MNALEEIAAAAKQRVALVDNAIWLLCERSGKARGLYLTNPQLAQMARRNESSNTAHRTHDIPVDHFNIWETQTLWGSPLWR